MCVKIEPLPKPYDYKVLIETYINARRTDYPHKDFTKYYTRLLAKLQSLFGVNLTKKPSSIHKLALWGLFGGTISSLLKVSTPWDGYLECGLVLRTLEEQNDKGESVFVPTSKIGKCATESAAAHREMLYGLFRYLYGNVEIVFTSTDLRNAGFDDSREPVLSDYYDYL